MISRLYSSLKKQIGIGIRSISRRVHNRFFEKMKHDGDAGQLHRRRRLPRILQIDFKSMPLPNLCGHPTPLHWILLLFLLFFVSKYLIQPAPQCVENTSASEMTRIYANMANSIFTRSSADCLSIAKIYSEPYSPHTPKQTIDLEGPVYASHRWVSQMLKDQIDGQKNRTGEKQIQGNRRMLFKIKDSVLYIYSVDTGYKDLYREPANGGNRKSLGMRLELILEMLLVTLHLYSIPDMDFAIELADNVHQGKSAVPAFSFSLKVGEEGFTMPSYGAYENAIGIEQVTPIHTKSQSTVCLQFTVLRECMRVRFPHNGRIEKIVWRGSSTGRPMHAAEDVPLNPRVALTMAGSRHKDILDIGIVKYVQVNSTHKSRDFTLAFQVDTKDEELMKKLKELAPIRERLPIESFNKYAAVIDVDGNSWSDRLPILLMGETVVLKQEYVRWLDYLATSLEASDAVIFIRKDRADLEPKTSALLREYRENRIKWLERLRKMSEFAQEYVSQEGVFRAMAYALTKYASFQNWEVELEQGYTEVPKTSCCTRNSALPIDLIKEISSSE